MNHFRMGGIGVFAVLAVALAGCQTQADEEVGSDQASIQNGDVAAANLAVVELYRNEGSWCTGIVISARHILTAAHCTDRNYVSQWYRVRAKTGYGTFATLRDSGRSDEWVLVHETVHPSWSFTTQTAGADVAILTLPATAPMPSSQAKHLVATQAPFYDEKLQIWGWGATNVTASTPSFDLLSGSGGDEVSVDDVGGSPSRFTAVVNNRAATCRGDSGGPATRYQNGNYIAVGAHRGANNPDRCAQDGATMYWAGYYDKGDWIMGEVRRAGITCTRYSNAIRCF